MVEIFWSKGRSAGELAAGAEGRGIDGVERAVAHGLVDLGDIAGDGGGDDEDGAGGPGHDLAGGLDAIHVGHDQIHQDQVGPIAAVWATASLAVVGHPGDFVAGRGDRRRGGGLRRRASCR